MRAFLFGIVLALCASSAQGNWLYQWSGTCDDGNCASASLTITTSLAPGTLMGSGLNGCAFVYCIPDHEIAVSWHIAYLDGHWYDAALDRDWMGFIQLPSDTTPGNIHLCYVACTVGGALWANTSSFVLWAGEFLPPLNAMGHAGAFAAPAHVDEPGMLELLAVALLAAAIACARRSG